MHSQIMTGVMTLFLGFAIGWLFFADMPWAASDISGSEPKRGQIGQGRGGGHGAAGRGHGGHGAHGGHGRRASQDKARQALDVERIISGLSRALSLTREDQAGLRKVLSERDVGIKTYQTQLGIALNSLDRLQIDDRGYGRDVERLRAEARAALDRLIGVLLDSRQAIIVELNNEQIRQMKLIRRSGRVGPELSHWP